MRSLPDELLETIFDHTLALSTDRHLSLNQCIMQVCHQWRDLALHFPPLWSTLPDVSWDTPAASSPPPHTARLSGWRDRKRDAVLLYLERSRVHPITFILHIDVNHFNADPLVQEESERLFQVLVSHSHRWANVDLAIPFRLLRIHSDSFKGRLPQLKFLSLKVTNRERGVVKSVDCFDSSSCPSLQHFSLASNNPWGRDELISEMPWAHLKTFTDTRKNPWETRTFAKHAETTDTIRCEITWAHPDQMRKHLESHFPATSITELAIGCTPSALTEPGQAECLYFADELTLPNLTSLKLGFGRVWTPHFSLTHVLSFLRRSGCPLKELDIRDTSFNTSGQTPPTTLSQILALCDKLEELRYTGLIPPSTLKAMTFADPASNINISTPLVPNLHTLRIRAPPNTFSNWFSNLHPALLNDLAKSRTDITTAGPKLSLSISIFFSDRMICCKVFCALERARSESSAGLPVTLQTASMLDGWKDALRSLAEDFGSLLSAAYYKQGWTLNEIVKEMEAYDIIGFEQILLLEEYNILDLLDCATYVEHARIPCAVLYKLPKRLRAVKEKFWGPFVNETDDGRRWVARHGGTSLAYGNESSTVSMPGSL